jgi:hypothetical protein
MAALGLDPANTTTTRPRRPASATSPPRRCSRTATMTARTSTARSGPSGLPYSDYTGFVPVNSPDDIADPNRWQPLRIRTVRHGDRRAELPGSALEPRPAVRAGRGDQFRPPPPHRFPHGRYRQQAEELIR